MRLLFILPEYVLNSGGGIITFYRHMLPGLAARGHEVRVLVGSGQHTLIKREERLVDGVWVENLERKTLDKYLVMFAHYAAFPGLRRHLAAAWALYEQARQGADWDIVEATDWGLLFVPWAVSQGPCLTVQMHGSVGQIDLHDPMLGEEAQGHMVRSLELQALSVASVIQGYSNTNAKFWHAQTGRSVACIRPAWRPENVSVAGPRSARGLVAGRVQQWKGPQILSEALMRLGTKKPEVDWIGRDTVFGTQGVRTSDWLTRQFPNVWGHAIKHRPQVSYAEIAALQASAGFVVVPSLWDTFNFTCVEAMSAGTPVICSTGAGAHELVASGESGFVFENGDAGSLASALESLLRMSPSAREAMGRAAKTAVASALEPQSIIDQREAAYAKLLTTGDDARPRATDFLKMAVSPAAGMPIDGMRFLDHLPLRQLIDHTARRGLSKLCSSLA